MTETHYLHGRLRLICEFHESGEGRIIIEDRRDTIVLDTEEVRWLVRTLNEEGWCTT